MARDPDDLFAGGSDTADLHRAWIWIVYAALFALSIPWYVPADAPPRIWLGLPHWVVLSLAAVLAIAVFTTIVIRRGWPDREPDADTPAGRERP